jgi:HPt (histidine-containing phosphotransfer) domain-containing protein
VRLNEEQAMKSIEHREPGALPAAADDDFERIRETFFARLRSDRVRLTTLAASLARIETHPAGVFKALQDLAHRIRGAAAVFGESGIGAAANELEQAAIAACDAGADHADGRVWSALEGLVELLALPCGTRVADQAGGGPRHTKSVQAKRR